ncbi:MAG TPA: hypothetical protein VF388_04850, partial [Lacunisphaera sp.]
MPAAATPPPEPTSLFAAVRLSALFSETGLLTLAFALMALAVATGHGRYAPDSLSLLLLGAVALGCAAWRNRSNAPAAPGPALEWLLALGLILLLVAGVFDSPGYHLRNESYRQAFVLGQLGLALTVGLSFLTPRARP